MHSKLFVLRSSAPTFTTPLSASDLLPATSVGTRAHARNLEVGEDKASKSRGPRLLSLITPALKLLALQKSGGVPR